MKPITTMRLRFITKKTPNAERRTPNVECRKRSFEIGIRRWALDVGRLLRSLECLHDGRAIKPEGKRTPGVNGDVIAEAESMRRLRFHKTKHLRCFAIKPFAKIDIRRDRMRPPIAFYSAVRVDIAHAVNFPEA